MELTEPDGNNLQRALIDRNVFELVRVTVGRKTHCATINGGRVSVGEHTLTKGFAETSDATVRVRLGGGAIDYVTKEIPDDNKDVAVTAAMILAAVYGEPTSPAWTPGRYVYSPYLALARGEDPQEALRKWPRERSKRIAPLADRIRELQGQVRVSTDPVSRQPPADASTRASPKAETDVRDVPIESQHTERTLVRTKAEVRALERRENTLVEGFARYLQTNGMKAVRKQIPLASGDGYLYNDVYVPARNQLIEAKGAGTRADIRMAIGQIADYQRRVKPAATAVLLHERPQPDLEDLLDTQGIASIWRSGSNTFQDNRGGDFV